MNKSWQDTLLLKNAAAEPARAYGEDQNENEQRDGTLDLSAAALVFALNWKSKACKCVHRCRERGATQQAETAGNATGCEVRGALTSATGTPSGGRQCSTIMPFRGTSVPWGSCSKFFLRSEGGEKKNQTNMRCTFACIHARLKISGSGGQGHLQAIRTAALRLLEVPRWLQATHRHQ